MDRELSPEQAMIYAMITIASVDRKLSDPELRRIGSTVRELPPFREFDETRLILESQLCGTVMSGPGGLNKVLDLIAQGLPAHLRETAYVLAFEVAISDHELRPEEVRFLELLARRLKIDPLIAIALERGVRARHQRLESF